ncbi:hypothetical protein BU16DRAFT_310728 [Lophium mytilinum]|uniref:Uncharacterized protein n=1 Tax=Lophium mytilinum TaxID=390894 RepID=A0A6A6R001_9PEZI|nr:hypothetical protein BU16DRAFT_310728 [Lophium mytilinum]
MANPFTGEPAWLTTPDLPPLITYPYDPDEKDVTKPVGATTSIGGYNDQGTEKMTAERRRATAKLFFFRYGTFTKDMAAISAGKCSDAEFQRLWKEELSGLDSRWTSEMVSASSWLNSFVRGQVMFFDFMNHMHNLARQAKLLELPPTIGTETANQKQKRERKAARFKDSFLSHQLRLRTRTGSAVAQAETERTAARAAALIATNAKAADIRIATAERALAHYRSLDDKARAPVASDRQIFSASDMPGEFIRYRHLTPEGIQQFWLQRFSFDVARTWWWEFAGVVAIRETLQTKPIDRQLIHRFATACHYLWKFVLGRELENERVQQQLDDTALRVGLRLPILRFKVADAIRTIHFRYYHDETKYPGISAIMVPRKTTSKKRKRAAVDDDHLQFPDNFDFAAMS